MNLFYLNSRLNLSAELKKKLNGKVDFSCLSFQNVNENQLIKSVIDAEIIIISPSVTTKITETFFGSLPNLKYMCLLSSGFDWVDVEAANKHKILISNCPGANVVQVNEYIWALILSLAKKLNKQKIIKNQKKEEGIELSGKTIGILGTGNIGKQVAKTAKSFNMKTLGFNRNLRMVKNFDAVTDLETLLKQSDIISINMPLTKKTKDLISKKEISLLKKEAILVNTSREEIVNRYAIIDALKSKKICGYGLDANIQHSKYKNIYDLNLDNLIVTEKNAYNTRESKKRMLKIALENINCFISGKKKNIIKP